MPKLPLPEVNGIEFKNSKELNDIQLKTIGRLHANFHEETDKQTHSLVDEVHTVTVAMCSLHPVGYASSLGGEFIYEIYVANRYRKQGIGEALLVHSIAPFFERDDFSMHDHTIVLMHTYTPMLNLLRKMQKDEKWTNYFEIQIQKTPEFMSEEDFHPDGFIIPKRPSRFGQSLENVLTSLQRDKRLG
jgi:ribosomal protein S18 acetylase RimI-like enzyme